ncbi:hypothetical protein MKJ04_07960 [Pontibacter sp. E15-1]|uniref:hypothetical protein n=1 Tax=Pontibacter sp. E15-1 TaxID=2919918 RepID=UPI001F4F77B7|nr:hypothetical protein [Pontibacter sp. E15-1]MCJ8164775.1 hypothetical protein [Pontibacter sp. E15-1]
MRTAKISLYIKTGLAASCMVVLFSVAAAAQGFEGKITYKASYKGKSTAVSDNEFAFMMGTRQVCFYKEGNYKSVMNGALFQWQLYTSSDNRFYNKMANSEAVYWTDASENSDEVLAAVVNKGVAEILGYPCDELVLTCKSGLQKYYFNAGFPLNPALFEGHKLGNWFAYLSRAKAIPLKTVVESEQLVYEIVAVDIKPLQLDQELFTVPENTDVVKSTF